MHEHDAIANPPAPRHPVRAVVGTLLLTAATVGTVLVVQRGDDAPATSPVVASKEVAVERGDLTDQESVDGTLVETDTIAVVHRIDGQTTSFTSSGNATANPGGDTAGDSTGGGAAPSVPGAVNGALSASASGPVMSSRASLTLALSTVELARPEVDTTTVETTVPDTTIPDTTIPDTTIPDTTTPDTTIPGSTTPGTTVPDGPPTSTPGGPTGSSVPAGGSVPTGGGNTPTGVPAGGTAIGGTGTGTSSGTVTQVVTGIATANDTIRSGDVLYTVESTPVVALRGAQPAWRTMSSSSDDGVDVEQLEAALVALGYDLHGEVTVDQEWDRATTEMVERWQRGMGVDDSGEVALGTVVFIAHDATVATVDVAVGDDVQDGTEVLQLTGTQQQVVITVPDELQTALTPSTPVGLGDGTGVVTRLRSADGDDGTVTVQALITPDAALDAAAGTTVKVTLSTTVAADALLVQTDALVSMLDGRYALEVPESDGSSRFVPVEVMGVSGNRTAISGDGLTDGMTVLAPA